MPGIATSSRCISLASQTRRLQGTSLPKEVAEQLDDMFEHKPLGAAADTIKRQYRKLRKWQAKLGQTGHQANERMEEVLRRQVILHLILLQLYHGTHLPIILQGRVLYCFASAL